MATTPANATNDVTTGVVRFSGTAFNASAITQRSVLVGGASNAITSVAPSSTSGVPLISQGSSSDPAFGTAVVAGGGTGVTSTTANGVICGGTTTTGAFQNAGTGTSGQVLISGGSSALPSWTDPASVGSTWVLIQTQTANNVANLDFKTGITSTYTSYVFVVSNAVPVNNNVAFFLTVSTDGGSTFLTTGYETGELITSYTSATLSNNNTTAAMTVSGGINNASPGLNGTFWLSNITTANPPACYWTSMQWGSTNTKMDFGAGQNSTTSGVNAFRWAFASGNISTGTFSLYGIRTS